MNTALKIGLGVGAVLVVSRMLQLGKLAGNVSISLAKIRIHKVDLSGITIAATARVNNPSNVSATIVNPVVRLWDSRGMILAESPSTGRSFPIAANRQSEVGEIMLPIGWFSILPFFGIKDASSLVQLFTKGGTKGLLSAISSPVSMSVIMQVDGMTIETPRTILNN